MSGATRTPVLDDDRITAFGMLVEATRRLERTFERTLREQHALTLVVFEALLRIGRSPNQQMSMSQLAEDMVLTSGGVTRLVDRLADSGFVTRMPCAEDRRVHWAQLTPEGLATIEAATATHVGDLDEHFSSRMSAAEMRTLADVCDRLRSDC